MFVLLPSRMRSLLPLLLLTACQGELGGVTPTPPPPDDPSEQWLEDVIYWEPLETGLEIHQLYAVAGENPSRLYMAGDGGQLWRWNAGTVESVATLTTVEGESPALYGMALLSDFSGKLVVAVGERGAIFASNLSVDGFEQQPTNTLGTFRDVILFGRADQWAVGDNGVYRFDATQDTWFRDTSLPGSVQLNAIWGTSADDMYVAGDGGALFHRSAEGWSRINLGRSEHFYALWGSASDSVYVAGQGGLILHFNGSDWQAQETGVYDNLWALHGLSEDQVFAGGTNGQVLYFDGIGWQRLPTGVGSNLFALWGSDLEHVYAAGARGSLLQFDNDPTPPPLEAE